MEDGKWGNGRWETENGQRKRMMKNEKTEDRKREIGNGIVMRPSSILHHYLLHLRWETENGKRETGNGKWKRNCTMPSSILHRHLLHLRWEVENGIVMRPSSILTSYIFLMLKFSFASFEE
ncbi:hypothetical protein [Pedobacter sp. N23S346]|uniref:hypothetical protein n=1 Tax=Pedobacter sp. N23S346 TaxID=3402750 RepID=UPI003ACCE62F